ncbi:MAG TPA: GTPase domain-containing protein [Tepidisphaeraceae bacterium]|nr:GTPase domain-containing protein [Tepidisphaeraceae bacterium]
MAWRSESIESRLLGLDKELAGLHLPSGSPVAGALARWRADAAALRFHLRDAGERPRVIGILGGTGTGKSTLVNRLLNANLSAASFRRTYTAGAVAIAHGPKGVPSHWLGVEHAVADADDLPARGEQDRLIIVPAEQELTRHVTLIDTPDLDGDQPAHHAQADRAFRWAQGVVFLVTPEKYQMTELLPYYRLAARYAVPSLFVMNKAEEPAVVLDYANQLRTHAGLNGAATVPVYTIPRDDAAYEPEPDANLASLRRAIVALPEPTATQRAEGLVNRTADVLGRLQDQIVAPLRDARREANRLIAALRAMESPTTGVDVNPITRQLQRRLQQRSILYLMGPGRMLDRVRQVPGLLVRLPRTAWDLVMKGKADTGEPGDAANGPREVPNFPAALAEQFSVVQSRIEDVLRSSPAAEQWLAQPDSGWTSAKLDTAAAAAIAEEELADLRSWLEKRWNATPRDTMILQRMLKYLPGGEKLTKWSEAAPYLLTIVVATHHAFFGHVDLMIIGGYTLATWLTERLSNEVASRTRATNRGIAERFERLAHEQITRAIAWLEGRAPSGKVIDRLQRQMESISEG